MHLLHANTLTRLSLRNQIPSKHGRLDSTLLDCRRLLETIGVDTPEKILRDVHGIERLDSLIPVGGDVGIRHSTQSGFSPLTGRGRSTINKQKEEKYVLITPHNKQDGPRRLSLGPITPNAAHYLLLLLLFVN